MRNVITSSKKLLTSCFSETTVHNTVSKINSISPTNDYHVVEQNKRKSKKKKKQENALCTNIKPKSSTTLEKISQHSWQIDRKKPQKAF